MVGTGSCNLVLNCGQTSSSYTPNNNRWCDADWKSITLTHTGDNENCFYCNQLNF